MILVSHLLLFFFFPNCYSKWERGDSNPQRMLMTIKAEIELLIRTFYLRHWKYYFVWDIEIINSRRTVRENIGVDTSPKTPRTKWSKSISTSILKALQVLQKLIRANLLHYIPSEQESSGAVNNISHSKYARQLYKFSTQNRCSKFPFLFW